MGEPNIFLFVPNLIGMLEYYTCPPSRYNAPLLSLLMLGYTRVILAIVSLYYMPFDPLIAGVLYLLSGLLDAFDGYASRALDQGNSKSGWRHV